MVSRTVCAKNRFLWLGLLLSFIAFMHAVTVFAGTKTLAWDPPTTNTDGTPLTDLAGYDIYYGPTPGNYTNTLDVGKVTTSVVNNLTDGVTYYFAVTAYNSADVESSFSNEVSNTLPPPQVTLTTFTITATAGIGGTITPAGTTGVNYGANQTITIAPSAGYHVATVLVDGVSKGAVTTYTFTSVTANHTIAASFAINTDTTTASAGSPQGSNASPVLSKTLSLHRYTMTITDASYDPDCNAYGHTGNGTIEVQWDGNNTWTRDTIVNLCSPTNNIYIYTYPSVSAHYNLNYYITDNAGSMVSSTDSISLPGPITISGSVTHADGSPFPNVSVYLFNAGLTGALTSAKTDSNGAYTLTRAWTNNCYDVRPISGSTVFTPTIQSNICDISSNVNFVGP